NAPNFGSIYVMLKPFEERRAAGRAGDHIAAVLQERLQEAADEGLVQAVGAPPPGGLGTARGLQMVLEDRGGPGPRTLQHVADDVVRGGTDTKDLEGLYTSFRARTPWLFLDINRTAARMRGVQIGEIFNTLQVDVGSLYVNDFNRFGRTWQVNVQASEKYRAQQRDLKHLKVRSDRGMMVPLSGLVEVKPFEGPVMVVRYNMYPSAMINGRAGPGVSSGEAIKLMDAAAAKQLEQEPSMRKEWTELALLQLQTGNTAMIAFALAVVLVFLVLAAQYESWSLPLAVILVVPMC